MKTQQKEKYKSIPLMNTDVKILIKTLASQIQEFIKRSSTTTKMAFLEWNLVQQM